MRRASLVGLLLAVLAPVWAGTAAQANAAESSCDGVWVVVDFGSLGGTETKCATSYGTGAAALRSAGFGPTIEDGFVSRIAGKPAKSDPTKEYWSYWQATLKSDGTYSGWSYSNLGATASHPQRGNAEGWRYQSLSDGKVPPGPAPPKGEASTPTPKPTQSAKPSPKPSPKPSATSKAPKPTATASPTKTPTKTPTKSATASAPAPSASPSVTTASTTPMPASTTTDTPVTTTDATAMAVPTSSDGGSPVGLIVAAIVIIGGGGGLGLWWYLRGRTR